MIYRLTIISNEEEDFVAEIQIDPYEPFLTLHKTILELCGYEDNQPTEFTICTNTWKRLQTITLEERGTAADEDEYLMEDTALNDFLEDEEQQFVFTFDPTTRRNLYLELTEIITGKSMKGAKITKKHGEAPRQTFAEEEALTIIPKTSTPLIDDDDLDDDDDIYEDMVSEEDIDGEGLDISEGDPFDS